MASGLLLLALASECLFVHPGAAAPAQLRVKRGERWTKHLADMAVPLIHDLVDAGSRNCDALKGALGLTYDQLQARRTPDTERGLGVDFITPEATQRFDLTSLDLRLSPDRHLVFIVHGFMESSRGEMITETAQAFFERGGYDILALDGSSLLGDLLYLRSSTHVKFIGERLGRVLEQIVGENGIDPKNITMVGHSLGAHVVGIAGKEFYRRAGVRVGRITALDPAGPCFTTVDEESRVRIGDADFVDVIHTDGGILGLKQSMGNQDYFPNGGSVQPGCGLPPCCHSRAWKLYAESVRRPHAFPAMRCADWAGYLRRDCDNVSYMGLDAVPNRPGAYFLTTASESPYADTVTMSLYTETVTVSS